MENEHQLNILNIWEGWYL